MTKIPKKESLTVEFKASFNEDVVETLVAYLLKNYFRNKFEQSFKR